MSLFTLLVVYTATTSSGGYEHSGPELESTSPWEPESTGPWEEESACVIDEKVCVTEGEALRIIPENLKGSNFSHDLFTWYRTSLDRVNRTSLDKVAYSSSEKERIHHHGSALLILGLSLNDSGLYVARRVTKTSQKCYGTPVHVLPSNKQAFYTELLRYDANVKIFCPEQVSEFCEDMGGNLTWYKNSSLLKGENQPNMWLRDFTNADNGIYTCRCNWTHNQKEYYSTASRMVRKVERIAKKPVQIISPVDTQHTVDIGSTVEIICSAYCGQNVREGCDVSWRKNGVWVERLQQYNETLSNTVEEPSQKSIFTAVLTFKVQPEDLRANFTCVASNDFGRRIHLLTLKPRKSLTHLVVISVCVVAACMLTTATIRYFAVDLVLFSRRFLRFTKSCDDGKLYDVYVLYQTRPKSEAMEKSLNRFFTKALPSVLEDKCGFSVFIHGRDDLPGEDRLQVVEECVRMSRRLMVVFSGGSEASDQSSATPDGNPEGVGYDWQVGLHQALVQDDMKVIMVQLGDLGPVDHTHLPAALQHLLLKSSPLKWHEGSRGAASWNSRFWKSVRYMMPAKPAGVGARLDGPEKPFASKLLQV